MEHTGIYGAVNGVSAIRNWSINEGYTTLKTVASNTQHGANRNRGIFDWTGSYLAYGHTPFKMPGEYLSFQGYKAPDAAGDVDNGEIFSGSAYVNSVAITINFQTNEIISHTVNFGGNGALSIVAGELIVDSSTVTEFPPCAGKVCVFDGTTLTRLEHITQAVLTFTREAKTTVNSGTSNGSGACLTKRYPGSDIDWTLALTSENGNEVPLLATGTIRNFRLFVDATLFWDLKWGLLGQRTGLQVDRETGNIISQVHNAEMKGFNAGVAGLISKPGGTQFWPAVA